MASLISRNNVNKVLIIGCTAQACYRITHTVSSHLSFAALSSTEFFWNLDFDVQSHLLAFHLLEYGISDSKLC